MALTTEQATNKGTQVKQNGKTTQVNGQSLVAALRDLYDANDDKHGTCYTVRELCEHMGVDASPSAARAFVAAANSVHAEPGRFLGDDAAVDMVRVPLHPSDGEAYCEGDHDGHCYHNWAFGLVVGQQVASTFDSSGFEGNTSHEVGNRVNGPEWGNYEPIEALSDAKRRKLDELTGD